MKELDAGAGHFMSLVFAAHRNDVFLVSALKTLTLDTVMVCARVMPCSLSVVEVAANTSCVRQELLLHLRLWLVRYITTGDKKLRKQFSPTRIPSFKQVCDMRVPSIPNLPPPC